MEDHEYHFSKKTTRTYVSRRFPAPNGDMRIASKVIDHIDGVITVKVKDELTIRKTPSGREEIKATFYEDNRLISTLTFQKYLSVGGPHKRVYFSFTGGEIDKLLEFVAGVKRMQIQGGDKFHVNDTDLAAIIMEPARARTLFLDNEELFTKIAADVSLRRDLVALGYRRDQLKQFERMLYDDEYFVAVARDHGDRAEATWQAFFEANKWIFGYGLSYVSLSALNDRKLEQITSGHDLRGAGKRVDALMKTNALISSLCFVEIKKHTTELVAKNDYRPEVWPPHTELTSGVAQVQVAVQSVIERMGRKFAPTDDQDNPTGEELFTVAPKSFLIIGSLKEFWTPQGINEAKFRSFELYRRNIHLPEIITFDELFHRAKYIVEHSEA